MSIQEPQCVTYPQRHISPNHRFSSIPVSSPQDYLSHDSPTMATGHTFISRTTSTYQTCFLSPAHLPGRDCTARNLSSFISSNTDRLTYACPQYQPRQQVRMLASRPFVSRIASGALRLIIQSLCSVSDDLHVDVDASSNLAALTGKLNGVSVTASRIEYDGFVISGGAALYTDEISITTRYSGSVLTAVPRLSKPFSVSIRASLTEGDLNRHGPVRDALEILLRQTIATGLSGAIGRHLPAEIGGVTCVLDRVELCDEDQASPTRIFGFRVHNAKGQGGKLILRAHATLSSGKTIFFAVRTGLATINDGNVLRLSDPEFLWRNLAFPMLTIDLIGIKFSTTTQLTDVRIDKGAISGDGIMVIAPPPDKRQRLIRTRNKEVNRTQRYVNTEEIRILPRKSQGLG